MIERVIEAKTKSIGSMEVSRVLPVRERRSVGPFIFVDEFGPVDIVTDKSMDVLPHPHIGLATVTYLFSGRMVHRDSLGTVQEIAPGQVNLMTAGSGIVHSERVSDASNRAGELLAGLQTWLAITEAEESSPASFEHSSLPPGFETNPGAECRLILGSLEDLTSVTTSLDAFYAEYRMTAGSVIEIDGRHEERAIYVVSGTIEILGVDYPSGTMPVLAHGSQLAAKANSDAVVMVLGGPPLEQPRKMFWNFVATRKELIDEAAERWRNQEFDPIPDESGFIPLPDYLRL